MMRSKWMVDYLPAAQGDGYLNDFEARYTGDFGAVSPPQCSAPSTTSTATCRSPECHHAG